MRGMGLRRIRHTVELVGHAGNARDDPQGAPPGDGGRVGDMATNLSNLKPAKGSKFTKKRVGRGPGSGSGKTAARGYKGAKSRSGFKFKRGFEGGQMPLHRRIPKRGFNNIFRIEYAVVNLDSLSERFEAGAVVDPDTLRALGPGQRPAGADQGAGPGRGEQGAHRLGPQVQRQGRREDCRRRRHAPRCSTPRRPDARPRRSPCSKRSRTCSPSPTCATACSSRWPCWACIASAATSRPPG